MSLGSFNRQLYNRNAATGPVYRITHSMFGTLTVSMAPGAQIVMHHHMNGELTANINLLYGYKQSHAMEGELTASANLKARIIHTAAMSGELTATFRPLLPVVGKLSGELDAQLEPYVSITLGHVMASSLNMFIDSEQEREYIMQFVDLDIPAGSTLVIDSDLFTITLDGENVIDRYSGDWIYFTRLLRSLEVYSGISGDLDVSVLYQERYL